MAIYVIRGSDAPVVDRICTEPCLVPRTRARPRGDSQSKTGWDSGTLMKNAAYSTASLSRYLKTQGTRQSSGSQASGTNNKGIIEMRQSDVQI